VLLTTPESVRWRNVALGLAAMVVLSYFAVRAAAGRFAFSHGGSGFGLVTGVLAFVLVLVLLFFGVRKRLYASRRLGRLEVWLQTHVWFGLLSLVLVLFHSGFRFHDKMAVAALVALVLVVATGVWGALLYTTVPRVLTEVSTNVPPEETRDELHALERSMERLTEGRSRLLEKVHRRLVDDARPGPLAGWRLLLTRPRKLREAPSAGLTAQLKGVEEADREALRELLELSRRHKELHQRLVLEKRYENLLRAWLFLHVPLSLALLVLMVAHAVAAVYYHGTTGWFGGGWFGGGWFGGGG
jgi:hypothetical protein